MTVKLLGFLGTKMPGMLRSYPVFDPLTFTGVDRGGMFSPTMSYMYLPENTGTEVLMKSVRRSSPFPDPQRFLSVFTGSTKSVAL